LLLTVISSDTPFLQASDGKIVLDNVTVETNKAYLTLNTTIGTSPAGFCTLSADAYILKQLSTKMMIKPDILDSGKKSIFPVPKFNFCQIKDVGDRIPFLQAIMTELSRFGNMVQSCPLKIGHYYLKEGFTDDSTFHMDNIFKPGQQYTLKIEATDESRRKPVNIFKIFLTGSYVNRNSQKLLN
jgi:Protein of unknown function (DUF1091)